MNGRQRFAAAFATAKKARRTALIPYFVAGYPSFPRLRDLLWEAQEAGATAIELGIPFSDPVADGPTLQAAIHQALQRGATVRKSLAFVKELRQDGFETPIAGMTYANLLYAPGYDSAARSWSEAGIDAAIVPDVPFEESGPLRAALARRGMGLVDFVSPATRADRLRRIAHARSSFLYLVAVYGTTGARTAIAPETIRLLRLARSAGPRAPLCVGFGVSKPDHVASLRRLGADGVVIGSALVPRIDRRTPIKPYLASLVRAGASR